MLSTIKYITARVQVIEQGSITASFQDCQIVNLEIMEKIRVTKEGLGECVYREQSVSDSVLMKKIEQLFKGMQYGKLVLFVKAGKVVQYSRQEQYRLPDYSDGI